jgi:hypothetical protein
MAGRRPLTLIDGEIKELPLTEAIAPLPIQGTTLDHVNGMVTIDPVAFNMSRFVADTIVPAGIPEIIATRTTNVTGSPVALPGSPQEGDVVVVVGLGPGAPGNFISTPGYFSISMTFGEVCWKTMDATPDTGVTLDALSGGGAVIALMRGVDGVVPVSGGPWSPRGVASSITQPPPDPPATTTGFDNVLVWCFAVSNSTMSTSHPAPSGFSIVHAGTIDTTPSASFSRLVPTAGPVDPGPYGSNIAPPAGGGPHVSGAFTTTWPPSRERGEKDYTVQFTNLPTGSLLYLGRLMIVVQATGGSFTFPGSQWLNTPPDFSVPGTHLIDYTLSPQGAFLTRIN